MRVEAPDAETVVIGAGVVGLAIAEALARRGQEVFVLERNMAIGRETSSRSSEVVHAGIYYPRGSLKAQLCVEGGKQLYRFAAENGVAVLRTGKLIVAASSEEEKQLASIAAAATANGVSDVRHMTSKEVNVLEPHVACTAALYSPSTGIVDSHGLMRALEGHLLARGGTVVLGTHVQTLAHLTNGLFKIDTVSGGTFATLKVRKIVAAAGHGMKTIAETLPRSSPYQPPSCYFAKGHYFTLRGTAPFKHLIYPVPVDGGLGVHLTLDLQGQARFGPDVQWLDRLDYGFDDPDGVRQSEFVEAIQRYWPAVKADDLMPGYTGIRPKTSGPGKPPADFAIHGPRDHGIANMVALYGIESPGLTSSLAIGEYVAEMIQG